MQRIGQQICEYDDKQPSVDELREEFKRYQRLHFPSLPTQNSDQLLVDVLVENDDTEPSTEKTSPRSVAYEHLKRAESTLERIEAVIEDKELGTKKMKAELKKLTEAFIVACEGSKTFFFTLTGVRYREI